MTDERRIPPSEYENGRERESEHGREREKPPAKISLLYESKDGRLCLFEDAEGHITAVRASSLA